MIVRWPRDLRADYEVCEDAVADTAAVMLMVDVDRFSTREAIRRSCVERRKRSPADHPSVEFSHGDRMPRIRAGQTMHVETPVIPAPPGDVLVEWST